MIKKWILYSMVLLVTFSLYCLVDESDLSSNQPLTVTLSTQDDREFIHKKISEVFTFPLTIKLINFEADFSIETSELLYLFDVKKDAAITLEDLVRLCMLLKKKDKIDSITLEVTQESLKISLIGLWTFKKLKIGGFFGYKDTYYSYYNLQPGEPFDKQKHEHSLQKLQELFTRDGYYTAIIKDRLAYEQTTKSITVYLNLERGQRFGIGSVAFNVLAPENMSSYDKEHLEKKLEEKFGYHLIKNTYTQDLLNNEGDLIRKYLFKKGFINASIALQEDIDKKTKKINLMFTIDLHQKKSFVFWGNHYFTTNALLENVLLFGRLSWHLPPSILSDELLQVYQAKGFLEVAIHTRQEADQFFFLINEGPRAVVQDLVFKGFHAFSSRDLKKSFFKQFTKAHSFFDAQILKDSLAALALHYYKNGFWDFLMLKHELVHVKDHFYTLQIRVDEGKQRFLSEITVEQFPQLFEKSPYVDLLKHGPIPFDTTMLQEQRVWLVDHFQRQGYHKVQAKPELIYNDQLVSVVWKMSGIDEKLYFGKPLILNAHKFSHKCIVRELQFKEGDVWSKEAIDKSLMRLKRLGVFQNIRLYPISWSDNFGYQPVAISLQEDDPFEVRVRAGVQQVSKNLTFRSGTTYKIGASLLYKNPFEFGDYLRADTDFTRFYRNVSVAYFRPWLFNIPVSTLFKGYSNKYNQPVVRGSKTTLYRVAQDGFLIELSRYYKYVDIGTIAGIELIETNKLTPEQAAAINFDQDLVDRNIPYIFFEPSVMIDFLDDKINPSLGTFTVCSLKTMIPLKKDAVAFLKILFQQSFFVPVARFLTFAWRLRFGHIFNQEFRAIMPIERFYLGGENSLRSYQPDLAPPLGVLVEEDGKDRFVPQGGRSMINANVELRFMLPWNLGFVLFQDAGALIEKKFSEIKGGRLLAATGFGFRYYSPIGPIRFDMGFKWKRDYPKQTLYACFLTLGHAFF